LFSAFEGFFLCRLLGFWPAVWSSAATTFSCVLQKGRKGVEHLDFSHRKAVCVHLKELLGQPDRERERGGREGGVMAPKRKTARSSKFADDAPWRAPQGEKPIPRISQGVVFPVRQGPNFSYAMSIMKVGFLSFFACLFVCLFVATATPQSTNPITVFINPFAASPSMLLKKIFLQVRVFHRFEELHKAHSLRWI